tara:strand:+ start:456 stop:1292 length:837 start_codon:yes stop_codon:yes gene_type:complete
MPVDRPENAEVVEKVDVTGMHGSVNDVVNDVQNENIGRHALNPEQTPSAIVTAAFQNVTTLEQVTSASAGGGDYDDEPVVGTGTSYATQTGASGIGDWKELTNWRLSADTGAGGAGYSLPAKCGALIYFNCRASRITTAHADEYKAWKSRAQLWLALGYLLDGTETYQPADIGVIRAGTDVGLISGTAAVTETSDEQWHDTSGNVIEQPVSMWTYIEPDAVNDRTIGGIRIRSAAIPGSLTGNTANLTAAHAGLSDAEITWDILGGQMGLIVFQKCAP